MDDEEFVTRYNHALLAVAELIRDPKEELSINALSVVRMLEETRHNLVQEIFLEYCTLVSHGDIPVMAIIQALCDELGVDKELKEALYRRCDLAKTPDAIDYQLKLDQPQFVAIIDFKCRRNIEVVVNETIAKYQKCLGDHIRAILSIYAETVVIWANPDNGKFNCTTTGVPNKYRAACDLINNNPNENRLSWIPVLTDMIQDLDNRYNQYYHLQRHSGDSDIKISSGHFTNEIEKMLTILTDHEKADGNNIYDDIYYYSTAEANLIRLYCLFCEYYTMDNKSQTLFQEVTRIVQWFDLQYELYMRKAETDPKVQPPHIVAAYFRAYNKDHYFKDVIDSIHEGNDVKYSEACKVVKKQLNKMYQWKVDERAQKYRDMKRDDLKDFSPNTPKPGDVKKGMESLINNLKESGESLFIHTAESKPNYHFLLPTWTCSFLEKSLVDKHRCTFNQARQAHILCGLQETLIWTLKQRSPIVVPVGDHIKNKIKYITSTLLSTKKNKSGCVIVRKSTHIDYVYGLLELLKEITPNTDTDKCIELYKGLQMKRDKKKMGDRISDLTKLVADNDLDSKSRKGSFIDSFSECGECLTDGNNYLIGSKRNKKLGIKAPVRNSLKSFINFCGVGKKSREQYNNSEEPTTSLYALKMAHDYMKETGHDPSIIVEESDRVDVKDCRSSVIDINCKECVDDTEMYEDAMCKLDTTLNAQTENRIAPIESKIISVIKEVLSAESYSQLAMVKDNVQTRVKHLKSSYLFHACEALETHFENLMVQSDFNKAGCVSICHSKSPDTLLFRMPGEKLFNSRRNLPYFMVQKLCVRTTGIKFLRELITAVYRNILTLIYMGDYVYIVSKPNRLDIVRMSCLSRMASRFLLTFSLLYDTSIRGEIQLSRQNDLSLMAMNAFNMATSVTMGQLSIRDPLKYMITLALADASDITGFYQEKFKYHIKTVLEASLLINILKLLEEVLEKRGSLRDQDYKHILRLTTDDMIEGGWQQFDVNSPFTGQKYDSMKQFINEVFCNVYCAPKDLHSKETNLMKLVETPCTFQLKITEKVVNENKDLEPGTEAFNQAVDYYLDKDIISKNTFRGLEPFEFDPAILILSLRDRLYKDAYKAQLIRYKIETQEKVKQPISRIKTMTSGKSSTVVQATSPDIAIRNTSGKLCKVDAKYTLMKMFDKIRNSTDLSYDDIRKSIYFINLIKRKTPYGQSHKKELEETQDKLAQMAKKKYTGNKNTDDWLKELLAKAENNINLGRLDTELFQKFVQIYCKSSITTYTLPVKESLYLMLRDQLNITNRDIFTENNENLLSVVSSINTKVIESTSIVDVIKKNLEVMRIEGAKTGSAMPVIKMFPKGQRTLTDREIYIMDYNTKCNIYYIEHTYKHVDKLDEYEAISLSGEAKSKFICDQEKSFFNSCANLGIENKDPSDCVLLYNHLNTDESKWSARDTHWKFQDMHIALIGTLPSERLAMLCIQENYGRKAVCVPDEVMQRQLREKASMEDGRYFSKSLSIISPIRRCTKDLTRNYFIVTSNWLQGNFNYTSSCAHTAVVNFGRDVHARIFQLIAIENAYSPKQIECYDGLVHSDDGTISSAIYIPKDVYADFCLTWDSYARFVFYLITDLKKNFCITTNKLKTFASNAIKDFISEYYILGEFIGCYARNIMNCCGESNFKNFKEDMYMLMGAAQNVLKKDGSLETGILSISVVNYYVYHTYSMLPGERNDPVAAMAQAIRKAVTEEGAESPLVDFLKITKMEDVKIERTRMPTCIGGYCTPPLHLLALYGAKIFDPYLYFRYYTKNEKLTNVLSSLTKNVKLDDTVKIRAVGITVDSIESVINRVLKDRTILPPIELLIGAYITRVDMGNIGSEYSPYDLQRLNHTLLFEYPSRTNKGLYPIKHPSFQDFISGVDNEAILEERLENACKKPEELVGTCGSNTAFLHRQALSHEIERRYRNVQVQNTTVQRLERLISSSRKLFLPINMLDSISKVKIENSLSITEKSSMAFLNSLISIFRGKIHTYQAIRSKKYKRQEFEEASNLKQPIQNFKVQLAKFVTARDEERDSIISSLIEEGEHITKPLIMLLQDEEYLAPHASYENLIRLKLDLGQAIQFVTSTCLFRDNRENVKSLILTLVALIFNDKLIHWALINDVCVRFSGRVSTRITNIQKVIYPFQTRRLHNRAEDIVKVCVLGRTNNPKSINPDLVENGMYWNDVEFCMDVINNLELANTCKWIQDGLLNMKQGKHVIEQYGSYSSLLLVKHFSFVYNLVLKFISLYDLRSSYVLTRAKKAYSAETFFSNFKGGYKVSNCYTEPIYDTELKNAYAKFIISSRSTQCAQATRLTYIGISITLLLQQILGVDISPYDVSLVLRNTMIADTDVLSSLFAMKDNIMRHIAKLANYIPFYYHLGILTEKEALENITREHIIPLWKVAHISYNPTMIGPFSVDYQVKGIRLSASGEGNRVESMIFSMPESYETDILNRGMVISSLLEKLRKDLKIQLRRRPEYIKSRMILYTKLNKYTPAVYSIERADRPANNREKMRSFIAFHPKVCQFVHTSSSYKINSIVIFSQMEKKDVLSLELWDKKIDDKCIAVDEEDSDRQWSMLTLQEVSLFYGTQNRNNYKYYNDFTGKSDTQKVFHCSHVNSDHLSVVSILSTYNFEIMGISLRALLETAKQALISTTGEAVTPIEDVADAIPGLANFLAGASALATVTILDEMKELAKQYNEKFTGYSADLQTQLLSVKETSIRGDVERKSLRTIEFEHGKIEILERFVTSNLNFISSISRLITGLVEKDILYKQDRLLIENELFNDYQYRILEQITSISRSLCIISTITTIQHSTTFALSTLERKVKKLQQSYIGIYYLCAISKREERIIKTIKPLGMQDDESTDSHVSIENNPVSVRLERILNDMYIAIAEGVNQAEREIPGSIGLIPLNKFRTERTMTGVPLSNYFSRAIRAILTNVNTTAHRLNDSDTMRIKAQCEILEAGM